MQEETTKTGLGDQLPFWREYQKDQNEQWWSRWAEGKWRGFLGEQLWQAPAPSSVGIMGVLKRPKMRPPAAENPQKGTVDNSPLLPVPSGKESLWTLGKRSLWTAASSLLPTLTFMLCTPTSAFSCLQLCFLFSPDFHVRGSPDLKSYLYPRTSSWAQLPLGTQILPRSDIHSKPLFCLTSWSCCYFHIPPLHSRPRALKPGLQCEGTLPSLPPCLDLRNGMWLNIPLVVTQGSEDCFEKTEALRIP